MKAPQFAIRTFMAFVVVIAFASFGGAMRRRSTAFASEAEKHRLQQLEDELNARAATYDAFRFHRERLTSDEDATRRFFLRHAEAEKRLYEAYRSAARHPWLPVATDPIAPVQEPATNEPPRFGPSTREGRREVPRSAGASQG
jgi:hypothetical protein